MKTDYKTRGMSCRLSRHLWFQIFKLTAVRALVKIAGKRSLLKQILLGKLATLEIANGFKTQKKTCLKLQIRTFSTFRR